MGRKTDYLDYVASLLESDASRVWRLGAVYDALRVRGVRLSLRRVEGLLFALAKKKIVSVSWDIYSSPGFKLL